MYTDKHAPTEGIWNNEDKKKSKGQTDTFLAVWTASTPRQPAAIQASNALDFRRQAT
jgi:hypothetical protein